MHEWVTGLYWLVGVQARADAVSFEGMCMTGYTYTYILVCMYTGWGCLIGECFFAVDCGCATLSIYSYIKPTTINSIESIS
jgi:hypothetical protein